MSTIAFVGVYGYKRNDCMGTALRVASYCSLTSTLSGIVMAILLGTGAVAHPDGNKAYISRMVINLTSLGILALPVDIIATCMLRCVIPSNE